jgi:hypothetical protein
VCVGVECIGLHLILYMLNCNIYSILLTHTLILSLTFTTHTLHFALIHAPHALHAPYTTYTHTHFFLSLSLSLSFPLLASPTHLHTTNTHPHTHTPPIHTLRPTWRSCKTLKATPSQKKEREGKAAKTPRQARKETPDVGKHVHTHTHTIHAYVC